MDGRPVSALAGLSPLRYHVATKRASPPAPPAAPWSPEASWGSLFIRRRPRLTPIVPFHPRGNLPDANLRLWSCGLPRKSMTPLIYTHHTPLPHPLHPLASCLSALAAFAFSLESRLRERSPPYAMYRRLTMTLSLEGFGLVLDRLAIMIVSMKEAGYLKKCRFQNWQWLYDYFE